MSVQPKGKLYAEDGRKPRSKLVPILKTFTEGGITLGEGSLFPDFTTEKADPLLRRWLLLCWGVPLGRVEWEGKKQARTHIR